MNTNFSAGSDKISFGIILLFVTLISCSRLPKPNFSFSPADNPEAGDTIQFTNLSEEATSYQWEFGDGNSSVEEDPYYIYERAGIYNIKLTAFNDVGEESIAESVTINKPTVLGFIVYDDTGNDSTYGNMLADAEVLVFDNDYDWEFKPDEPLKSDITDNSGLVLFENMEPIVYYIIAVKEEPTGAWIFIGQTPTTITQNEVNLYNVPCVWIENQTKATLSTGSLLKSNVIRQLIRSPG